MKLKISILVFGLLVGTLQINAQTTISVIATDGSGPITMPDSSPLADGTFLEYGVFDSVGFASLAPSEINYTSLSALFSTYGTLTFSGGNITSINQPLSGGTAGDQLSIFVFTTDFVNFGVFSSDNGLWDYPSGIGGATLSSADINISYSGAGEIISGSPDSYALSTAVPEPSQFAALFGVFALGFVVWRRRR